MKINLTVKFATSNLFMERVKNNYPNFGCMVTPKFFRNLHYRFPIRERMIGSKFCMPLLASQPPKGGASTRIGRYFNAGGFSPLGD